MTIVKSVKIAQVHVNVTASIREVNSVYHIKQSNTRGHCRGKASGNYTIYKLNGEAGACTRRLVCDPDFPVLFRSM